MKIERRGMKEGEGGTDGGAGERALLKRE